MSLKQTIESVFTDVPYPGDGNITRCPYHCAECLAVAKFFKGRSWQGNTVEELREHHTALALFTPEAFHYFLPAFMLASIDGYDKFTEQFKCASEKAGKDQYLIPYFISGHPGSTLSDMVKMALYLKAKGYRPRQVQDFIPTPMSLAATMYHSGLDPLTMKPCYTAKGLKEKRLQKALLLYWDPEQADLVREALIEAGRKELIGNRPECLVGPAPGESPRRTPSPAARRTLLPKKRPRG